MKYNEEYWNNFYSYDNELPLESSNFAAYVLRFLQTLPEISSYKNILDIGCGNGRDAYFFSSQGYKVTGIDSCAKVETDKFQFQKKNIFDYEINELHEFDVCYLRFLIHTLSEQECDQLFARLALLPTETLIAIETRSTTNITKEEKLETFFSSPIGDEHFTMLYSKHYMDQKISDKFIILESSDSSDVDQFKSENPFCLRYIIQPKR
ncbi:AdoMet_MTases domain containing protein [Oxalobacteraceae bacterium]